MSQLLKAGVAMQCQQQLLDGPLRSGASQLAVQLPQPWQQPSPAAVQLLCWPLQGHAPCPMLYAG